MNFSNLQTKKELCQMAQLFFNTHEGKNFYGTKLPVFSFLNVS